ncbi:sialyltransferase [Chloropicon primus]|uniref:Sialyltransferase n=1 Tax=Chloropicon primus TaxID=1764295 RepID=A0A5B8MZT6_9CHLO|nr:sialyltransferase [Chloropicon primus]UPR04733.1 sialyltransferase [Chloropicon primus]|eukprot:QDZ25536.1 sialyltransferase [Chloropicon primus]
MLQQILRPKGVLSVLLFVYTLTVISRVPHSVLHDLSHRKAELLHLVQVEEGRQGGSQHDENIDIVSSKVSDGQEDPREASSAASMTDDLWYDGDLEGKEVEFDATQEYRNIDLPVITVHSIEPRFAPRAGGIAAIIRGRGFSALTNSKRQIGRKLHVLIGDVPCGETRWVSDGILKCLLPVGSGTGLEVTVQPCICSGDGEKGAASEAEVAPIVQTNSGVVFSYTEDLLKGLVNAEPALEVVPNHQAYGIQMHTGQLIPPFNLEVTMGAARRAAGDGDEDSGNEAGPDISLSSHAILPELARVLPQEDWQTRHATCAVVGKSGSLLGSKLGSTIDKHSAVFRIDNAPSGSKYSADVGKKVTYQLLDAKWSNALLNMASSGVPHVARWWLDTAAVVLWASQSQSNYVQLKYLYPEANIVMLSRAFDLHIMKQFDEFSRRLVLSKLTDVKAMRVKAEKLGSLIHAVSMALQVCENVDIYGVFPRCGLHSKCRQTFFDDSELTAGEKVEHEVEKSYLMALGALHLVNTTTPVRVRDDGKPVKHPALSGQRRGNDGKCDEVMCRLSASQSSSPFQCTEHTRTMRDDVVSNSCRCEKTWGGRFCERDMLELGSPSLASQVMKGINLNYNGSLLMGRETIIWDEENSDKGDGNGGSGTTGYIELPQGTTRNRTFQGDYYEMNRHMYNMLPENDNALFRNLNLSPKSAKVDSCAVIGNSGSLLHNPHGEEIDNHTMVYRFNQAPTAGFEVYTGVRTTHESLNSAWVKALVETIDSGGEGKQGLAPGGNRWRWRKKDTTLVLFEMFDIAGILQKTKDSNLNKEKWWKNNFLTLRSQWPDKAVLPYNPLFVVWAYRRYGDFKKRFTQLNLGTFPGEKPMSGFYAILFLMQACERVDLYGFEAYQESAGTDVMGTKYHYFDDAVPRHNSHSFDLTQYIYRAIAHANPRRLRIRS